MCGLNGSNCQVLAGAGISHGKPNFGERRICHGAAERWLFGLDVTIFSCHDKFSKLRREANKFLHPCVLTARRYNLVSVTRRSIREGSWFFSHKVIPVQGEYGMCFCCPGTRLAEFYACRGTKLKDGSVFIVVHRALKRALARSRYNLLQICHRGRSKMQKP